VLAAKLDEYERLVDEADAIVLSDYGKGGLAHVTRMIEAGKGTEAVLVDPKGSEYERYRGATLLTPTAASSARWPAAGPTRPDLARRAQKLRADLALEALIVTERGRHVALHRQRVPARADRAREVFDVSGAGDTVSPRCP